MHIRNIVCSLVLLFAGFSLWGKQVPPPSNTLVTDYANILTPQEREALERKLVAYDDSTSTQIAVVIERSLEGDDLFDYTMRLVESWGIGGKGKDNGVLVYIAFEDRKIIIQTGYGTEGFLPDVMARRIIQNVIAPAFRQQRYHNGLDEATTIVMQLGSGEYVNEDEGEQAGGISPIALILIILIIVVVLASIFGDDGDDGGYYGGGRYDMDSRKRRRKRGGGWIFFPGGSWGSGGGGGGFGGFGGGGGGFGGFGGGGFGGGGASGGW